MSVAYDLGSVAVATPSRRAGEQPLNTPRRLSLVPPPERVEMPARVSSLLVPAPSTLRPPADAVPLRLTHRGVLVAAVVTALVAIGLVVTAALSARASSGGASTPAATGPAVVTVHAGDTLWSIASAAAPGSDPQAEVDTLVRLNSLHGAALVPGQHLRLR